jgi:hypothetical protein
MEREDISFLQISQKFCSGQTADASSRCQVLGQRFRVLWESPKHFHGLQEWLVCLPSAWVSYAEEGEEVTLRLTVSQSVCLGIEHACGTCDQILLPVGMLLCEICGLVSIWRPLWREDGSAICSVMTQRSWPVTILYCFIWDSPNLEG